MRTLTFLRLRPQISQWKLSGSNSGSFIHALLVHLASADADSSNLCCTEHFALVSFTWNMKAELLLFLLKIEIKTH